MNEDKAALDTMRVMYTWIGYMTYLPSEEYTTPTPGDMINYAHQEAGSDSPYAAYGWMAALNHWDMITGIILMREVKMSLSHFVYAHMDGDSFFIIDYFEKKTTYKQYEDWIIYTASSRQSAYSPGRRPLSH